MKIYHFSCLLLFASLFNCELRAQNAIEKNIDSLLTLVTNYKNQRQYAEMLDAATAAGNLISSNYGKMNERYANCLLSKGQAMSRMNRYDEAEQFYVEATDILGQVPTLDSLAFPKAQINLAKAYYFMSRNEKAERLFLEGRATLARKVGTMHPEYATASNSLGNFYNEQGQYERALKLFFETRDILEANGLKESVRYASLLVNIGFLNSTLYRFDQAESLYLEANAIMNRIGATTDQAYASLLNNLGGLYHRMGQYDKAEKIYLDCKAVRAQTDGTTHPAYGVIMMNLGMVYGEMGNYTKAESFYLETREIFLTSRGKESLHYATIAGNLGDLYRFLGQYDKAEQSYLESIDIFGKLNGKDSDSYAGYLTNLALLNVYQGRFSEAEQRYSEARVVLEKFYSANSPENARILGELAEVYRNLGQTAKAQTLYLQANEILLNYLRRAETYMSATELEQFQQRYAQNQDWLASLDKDAPSTLLHEACLDNLLLYKNKSTNNDFKLEQALSNGPESLQENYKEWKSLQRKLNDELVKPLAEQSQLTALESRSSALEKTLTKSLPGFSDARRSVNWQSAQAQLRPAEAAVEFFKFHYAKQRVTDKIFYTAMVTRYGDTIPQYVPLFEEKQLVQWSDNKQTGSTSQGSSAADLYTLVWRPLEHLLAGTKTVYLAPAGRLHGVAFAGLADGKGNVLADRFQMHIVGCTNRMATSVKLPTPKQCSALLLGDVAYNCDSTTLRQMNVAISASSTAASQAWEMPGVRQSWSALQGSKPEIESVNREWSRAGVQIILKTGAQATEEFVRTWAADKSQSPDVLHFSTYVFGVPQPAARAENGFLMGQSVQWNENPSLRSGIILAGANRVWTGGKAYQGMEDGMLTAYEISQLNLSHTRLVVLTGVAEESGLKDTDGMQALYQAFKRAGARYVLVKLKPVPEVESALFLNTFYQYCLKGKDIPEAFAKTQRKLQRQNTGANWASWVLFE